MDNIADFVKWIQQLCLEVESQTTAVMELAVCFADGEQQQNRREQAASLRTFKERVMQEVEGIRQMELAEQGRDNKIALFGKAPAAFVFGSLYTAATLHKDAYRIGLEQAGAALSKRIPFGKVLTCIGKEGLPQDLKIIAVSRFARESNKAEPAVEMSWQNNGFLLMNPEEFAELIDKVGHEVLDGTASLPMSLDEVVRRIA